MGLEHGNIDFTAHAGLKSNSEIKNQMMAEKSMDDLLGRVNFSSKGINKGGEFMAFLRGKPELYKAYEGFNSFSNEDKNGLLDLLKKHIA